ncbi:ATP-binding cassette domain-containing protein [Myxacorys almedinensis A]|uniref:ATP-binding cassette domain-containing protein n=1 Tax=Myxacorys almedinensis A TaxID=2690445 RepID=A0A8J7Z8A4_9CYAN|nr:ATP-binding cassette domain-containing protein [Myxacorys almedinensis A]
MLRSLSFNVSKGERIAIVGASGSGKTSLLKLLNRLSDPTQGLLYFEGKPFSQIPAISLRQQIILVSQEPKLLGMTVQQAIEYPLKLRGLPQREVEQRVNEGIERLQIPRDWLERTELQMSVGERQWVAIARAFVCQPAILALDEPTASLDARRQDQLLKLLSDLPQTVLVATHNLDFAAQCCLRVLHLHRGELIHNEASDRVDWQELRDAIAHVEAEESAEWD